MIYKCIKCIITDNNKYDRCDGFRSISAIYDMFETENTGSAAFNQNELTSVRQTVTEKWAWLYESKAGVLNSSCLQSFMKREQPSGLETHWFAFQ